MSVGGIEQEVKEIYQFELSTSAISRVTERVLEDSIALQNRPLDPVYLVVWMSGISTRFERIPESLIKQST